ncbi:hypothetical protein Plec18167_005034 [Paecilomyces lecythidis]|uniref:Uncharacterized protein n=1 Tax=Paecilomyces lecythidis TaxID=3004212 RepID=A0ABR3XMD3_9EURO
MALSPPPTTTTNTKTASPPSATSAYHPPVPHPILIPLIPSLALLATFLLLIYLNWDSLRGFLPCWRGRSIEHAYQHVRVQTDGDGDESEGEDGHGYEGAYGSRKTAKQQHARKRTGDIRRRLGLRSKPRNEVKHDTGTEGEDEEIEMRPLMRPGPEEQITRSSASRVCQEERDEWKEQEREFFFVSSGPSTPCSTSESGGDKNAEVDIDIDYDEGNPHEKDTDTLSFSKYFNPQTHVLRPEYKKPPSPVTEAWEIELRQRIREGGSVAAWVDHVVDSAAEWWEGMST